MQFYINPSWKAQIEVISILLIKIAIFLKSSDDDLNRWMIKTRD
jgi:Tfp pilus assembly protein PilP